MLASKGIINMMMIWCMKLWDPEDQADYYSTERVRWAVREKRSKWERDLQSHWFLSADTKIFPVFSSSSREASSAVQLQPGLNWTTHELCESLSFSLHIRPSWLIWYYNACILLDILGIYIKNLIVILIHMCMCRPSIKREMSWLPQTFSSSCRLALFSCLSLL